MIVKRDLYLNKLVAAERNGLIKVITGLRRSGKTYLLFNLFRQHLIDKGVSPANIITVAFDDIFSSDLRDPFKFMDFVKSKMSDGGFYYLLLDEVQLLDRFVDVLNSFLHRNDIDVYVTGSNSRFLSHDVVTEFRGRSIEVHVYPLSFSELYSAVGGDRNVLWHRYLRCGGLPQLVTLDSDRLKEEYLVSLFETVYVRDILERNKINGDEELVELFKVLASSVGSPVSASKISKTFKSVKGLTLSDKTVSKYIEFLQDAFLVEKSMRYDVKGRKYIGVLSKYYFQDIGIRNALLDFRQVEETHLMENVIYNELRTRGFRVDVGVVESRSDNLRTQFEIDFVANMSDARYYIQSAFSLPDEAKRLQESASLLRVSDGFKRVIIVRDDIVPSYDENGIFHIGLMDFLLNPNALDVK